MTSKTIDHNVIVLGSHTTALYIVRSLGRSGAKVAVVDTNSLGEARFSTYCHSFTKIERFTTEAVIDAIQRVSKKLGPCAIYPTNDEAVRSLSQGIDSIGDDNVAIVPPWPTTFKAYDKHATYELAQSVGVPVPRTFYLNKRQDIADIARECEFPVLIKPTIISRW